MSENLCDSCFLKLENHCYCTGKPVVLPSGFVTRCDYHYKSDYLKKDKLVKGIFISGFCWATENHNHILEEYKKLKNSREVIFTHDKMIRLQNIIDDLGDFFDDLQQEYKEDDNEDHD